MSIAATRLTLIVLSYVAALVVAYYFGFVYAYLFPNALAGGFIGDPDTLIWIAGYPLAIVFLLTFGIHALGGHHIWWWNVVPLAPAILFELVLDPLHLYLPIITGVVAWGLGILANKMLWRFAPEVMAKLSG